MISNVASYSGTYHRASSPSPHVLLLELNRPPVNAFHDEMWQELQSIVERVSSDATVRAIVLASAWSKGFTAGLDLTSTAALTSSSSDPARKALELRDHIVVFQRAISSLSHASQPVIVALHGMALGLGVDIASACDVRLAAHDTVFGILEVNVGLAADIGTLQRFPKVIGNDSKARELALSGRRFSAEDAKAMGFVSEVVPGGREGVIRAAVDLAKLIASKSPIAVMGTKHLMNHAREHTVDEGLEYTAVWNMSMLQASDTSIAMKAALAKRDTSFPPLREARAKL